MEFFAVPRPAAVTRPSRVADRQGTHEVLNLIAAGRSNTDIARPRYWSPKTVRNHISNVFAKLQVADRAQAIVRAREACLGPPALRFLLQTGNP